MLTKHALYFLQFPEKEVETATYMALNINYGMEDKNNLNNNKNTTMI